MVRETLFNLAHLRNDGGRDRDGRHRLPPFAGLHITTAVDELVAETVSGCWPYCRASRRAAQGLGRGSKPQPTGGFRRRCALWSRPGTGRDGDSVPLRSPVASTSVNSSLINYLPTQGLDGTVANALGSKTSGMTGLAGLL